MDQMEAALAAFANFMWGPPLVVLLVGGGLFFTAHSKLMHFGWAQFCAQDVVLGTVLISCAVGTTNILVLRPGK